MPHESAMEYVRVMVRGHVPVVISLIINEVATIPQLSLTEPPAPWNAVRLGYAAGTAPAHANVPPAGQVIVGFMVSSIVIVCIQVATLPQESAIEYVRVIVRGHEPEVLDDTIKVDNTSPQLSEAEPPPPVKAAKVVSGAGTAALHCTTTFAGHVMTGFMVSSMVNVCIQDATFPQESAIE